MINKPQCITIFRGDDTDFDGSQPIEIVISTELDLTGCAAHFKFLDFQQDFDEIPQDRSLIIKISRDETIKFPVGLQYAKVWVEKAGASTGATSKIRTLENAILVEVTNNIKTGYGSTILIRDHSVEVLTQDGIFYIPVFIDNDEQVYRRLEQHEDTDMGGITTKLSETTYVKRNGLFVSRGVAI